MIPTRQFLREALRGVPARIVWVGKRHWKVVISKDLEYGAAATVGGALVEAGLAYGPSWKFELEEV